MGFKKLSNGNYFIRVKVLVNKKSKELKFTGAFATIGAVRAKEKSMLDELLILKKNLEAEELRYTWIKAVKDYLEDSENRLRLSTYHNRKVMIQAHTTILNEIEIKYLNKTDFKKLFGDLSVTTSTKNELLKYCRQVLELALENRRINFNPLKNVNFKGEKNERRLTSTEAMTHDEIVRVLEFVKEVNHEFYEILFVTYQFGMRSGEAVALKFTDVDWEKEVIHIKQAWCKTSKSIELTKNGHQRTVPMNDTSKKFLRQLHLKYADQEFVLPRNKFWINGGMAGYLRQIQKQLGIRLTDYHSLRASFITNLLKNGVSTASVQCMVGHVELKTTQRYIRLHGTDLKGTTDFINMKIEN